MSLLELESTIESTIPRPTEILEDIKNSTFNRPDYNVIPNVAAESLH